MGEGVRGLVEQRPEHLGRDAGGPLPPTNTSGRRTPAMLLTLLT